MKVILMIDWSINSLINSLIYWFIETTIGLRIIRFHEAVN